MKTHSSVQFAAARRTPQFLLRPLAQALAASAFFSLPLAQAQTLPTGLKVVQGTATVSQQGSRMTVTNTPNAILNWDRFSIGAGAKVHFQQQSAASKVLNRVVGRDPSNLLGDLTSNGQVWLLNPNGILFGAQSRVDVAGLVASTLSVSDADFSAGRMRFGGESPLAAGGITNQGLLQSAHGGLVALVATEVRNEGRVQTPDGQAVLAAGRQVELFDSSTPHVSVRVPLAAGEVFNSGLIEAGQGRVDILAAAVRQDGTIRADGAQGGTVTVEAQGGTLMQTGTVSAQGTEGNGGQVRLLGAEVGLVGTAAVDASGAIGGGEILIGGGPQGRDSRWTNARAVYLGTDARLNADATRLGDGGRVILWSDSATRAYGHISAQGGAQGGDGGFIETSGGWLDARPQSINTLAPKGKAGQWLLDPLSIEIVASTGPDINVTETSGLFAPSGSPSQVTLRAISGALSLGQNVTVTTAPGTGDGDIFWRGGNLTLNGLNTQPLTLSLIADRNIQFDTGSTISSDSQLHLNLQAGRGGQGGIQLNASTTLNTAGNITLGGSLAGAAPGSADGFPSIWIDSSSLTAGGTLSIKGNNTFGSHGVELQGGTYRAPVIEVMGKALGGKGVYAHGASLSAQTGLTVRGEGQVAGVYLSGESSLEVSQADAYLGSASLTIDGKSTGGEGVGVLLSGGSDSVLVRGNRIGDVLISGTTDSTRQPAVQIDGGGNYVISNSSVGRLRLEAPQGRLELNSASLRTDNTAPDSRSVVIRAKEAVWNNSLLYGGDDIRLMSDAHVFSGGSTQIGASVLVATDGIFSLAAAPTAQAVVMGFGGGGAGRIDNQVGSTLFAPAITQWTLVGVDPRDSNVFTSGQRQFNPNGLAHDYRRYGAGAYSSGAVAGFGNGFWFTQNIDAVVSGTVASKVYDSTTSATASGVTVAGLANDTLTFSSASAAFSNKSAGTARTAVITVAGLSAVDGSGKPVYGYNLLSASATADITPAPLVVTGLSPQNKVYDTTIAATLAGSALVTPLGSDAVSVAAGYSGQFSNKSVGTGKPVTVTGLTLTGADAVNYTVVGPSGLQANITPAALTVTGLTAQDKVYDTTTVATVTGNAAVSPLGSDAVSVAGSASGAFGNKNVGVGKLVSITGLSLAGADAGNYSLLLPTLTAAISPAPLLIGGLSAQNKVYDATQTAPLSGTASFTVLGSDSVSLASGPIGQFSDKNVGVNKSVVLTGLSLSGADAANYAPIASTTLQASITPAPLVVSGLSAQSKVYDTSSNAPLVGSAAVSPLGSDAVSLIGSAIGQFANKNVGSNKAVTVTGLSLTGADAGNYTFVVPSSLQADITPAPLPVIGLLAQNKVYDATAAATLSGTAAISPLGGDSVSLVGSASGLFSDKHAGESKPVNVTGLSLAGADAGNYSLLAPALSASINPAPLAVSGLSAQNKVYDATLMAPLSGTANFTVLGGDSVSAIGSLTGQFSDKNVGANKVVTLAGLNLSGPDAGNYSPFASSPLQASITPAPLVVSGLMAQNKVYDATLEALIGGNASVNPLGSDVVSVSGNATGRFGDKNVGSNKVVTVTGLSLTGADAANYTAVAPSGLQADITPAPLAVSGLNAQNKVYDTTVAAALSGTAQVSPLGSDRVNIAGSASAQFSDKNANSNKAVTVTGLSLSGADAGNYSLTVPVLSASITPAPLVVSGLSALDKVYDATLAVQLKGSANFTALGSDSVGLVGSLTGQFSDKNVGAGKTVAITGLSLTGADAANYSLVAPSSLLAAITPAPLVVNGLTAQDKVYDATRTAQISGNASVTPLGGDVVTVEGCSCGQFDSKNVGSNKTVTVTGLTLGGADAGNYLAVVPNNLTASITPAAVTLTGLTAQTKVYDTTTVAQLLGTPSVMGLGGDALVVTGSASAQFGDKNVGSNKAVTVSGVSLSGADAGNYTFTVPLLSASITPAPLVVSGLAVQSKVYDATPSVVVNGSPQYSALPGDAVKVSGSLNAHFQDKHVGTNKNIVLAGLTLEGPDATNYSLVLPVLGATITPAPLTIVGLQALDKTYDATTVAQLTGVPTATPLGTDNIAVAGGYEGQFGDKNVGTNKAVTVMGLTLTGADAGNYSVVASLGLQASIHAAPLTVSGLSVQEKVYDATTAARLMGSAALNSLAGDSVGLAPGYTAQFLDKNAGAGKAVTLLNFQLNGSDSANYRLRLPSLTGTIVPATLRYVAEPAKRIVGQPLGTLTGTVTGWVGGDTPATAATGSFLFSSPGLGQSGSVLTQVGVFPVVGSGLSALNYVFVQAQTNAEALQVLTLPNAVEQFGADSTRFTGLNGLPPALSPFQPNFGGVVEIGAAVTRLGLDLTPANLINTRSMSREQLQSTLDHRAGIKRRALAASLEQLSVNPDLADLSACTTREDAEAGRCVVVASLLDELAQERVTDVQPTVSGKASGLPPPPAAKAALPTVAPTPKPWVAPSLGPRRPVVTATLPQIQRKIAVFIGVNEYQDGAIPALENAVGDAEAMAKLAEGPLGYETLMLRNPTKAQVVATLNRLAMEVTPQDQVLIYYAGHGDEAVAQETGVKHGYWQLADSSAKSPQSWLSNNDIGRVLNLIKARQIALLSDSCYSGRLVDGPRVRAVPGPLNPNEVLSDRTVVVMSSGGNAPVADAGEGGHSPFAFHLLQTLGKLQSWKPGANIFETVRFRVANKFPQSPQYGYSGTQAAGRGGDYLFEQRQLAPR